LRATIVSLAAVGTLALASAIVTDAQAATGGRTVPCREMIGATRFPYLGSRDPAHRYRQVLGSVAAPPAFMTQTAETGDTRWPYWHKQGLVVRAAHAPVTVTVPPAWRHWVAISWGYGGTGGPFHTLRIAACPSDPAKGNAYAGGFYLSTATACVPLRFTVVGRSATVWFGIGRRCAGHP
jgi:hypothetical protein